MMPKQGQFSLRAVMRVYGKVFRRHRLAAVVSFTCMTGVALVSVITPLYYKQFLDVAIKGGAGVAISLISILVVILGINMLDWVLRRIGQTLFARFEAQGMNELAQTAFSGLLGHSYAFFTNNFAGSLVRKVNRLSRSFEDILDRVFYNMLQLIVSLIGIIIVLFIRSPLLGTIFLIWTLVMIALQIVLANFKLRYSLRTAEKDTEATGALSDAVANEAAIKLFTGRTFEEHRFAKISDELSALRWMNWKFDEYVNGAQALLAVAIEFGLMYAGVLLWQRGIITVGDFALIQAYVISAISQLWNFGNTLRRIYESFADASEMVDILNLEPEVTDVPGATMLAAPNGQIEFCSVDFNFKGRHSVLNAFSLSIGAKEKIALVGPSGAGKTTITKLLLRLHDVDGGEIRIDDQNIATVTQDSLRSNIALVPQEPALFHRTLMENIRYGKRNASDEEVFEAAKQANCYEFISKYPQGFETYVGERGVKLSGGERQRVAIARAILRNAPILILDEATSSLDSESEALIQDALIKLMEGKTVIAIAHRLSTIMKMDRIIVMEGGQVVLTGTHKELLAGSDNLYKKLWEIQAGGFQGFTKPEEAGLEPIVI